MLRPYVHHALQGRDEVSGDQVGPKFSGLKDPNAPLDYEEVKAKLEAGKPELL